MKYKIIDIRLLKNKVVLYFQNEQLAIDHNTYTEFKLYLHKELTEQELKKIKSVDSYIKHLNYALKLINRYSYTTKKLKQKLIKKNVNESTINQIIDYLVKHQLLDDALFATSYAHSLVARHKGVNYITHKLKQLGINDKIIDQVINNLNQSDLENALKTYIKKLDEKYTKQKSVNKKEKIIASLLRSGYTMKEINYALSKIRLTPINYIDSLKKDYQKIRRQYDEREKIINALRRKGYSYSKIKMMMEEDYDLS